MSISVRRYSSPILGLLILAGLAYGLFVAGHAIIRALASSNSNVAVAIIAASATVLVSVLSIVLGKVYESRSLIQKEHREKKVPVYEDLINFLFRASMSPKASEPISQKDMIEFMSAFTPRAMVWASDEVLAAWVKWRKTLINDTSRKVNSLDAIFLYEELIFTIRRDLGHKNKALVKGDILALFVNDIDQYLPPDLR